MFAKFFFALLVMVAVVSPLAAFEADDEIESRTTALLQGAGDTRAPERPPAASSTELGEVFKSPSNKDVLPEIPQGDIEIQNEVASVTQSGGQWQPARMLLSAEEILKQPNRTRQLLGVDIPPATSTRLIWRPSHTFSGMALDTPVLVVNGAADGPTLCLTAAIHGDELNGIEMIRRVMYDLDPEELHGTVIGVPIVNLLGFSRHSRYLPDRRDLNRYFPGNPSGSVASRIASAFFDDVVNHCNTLLDIHTGSFYRTNIPQLRADMNEPRVVDFVELFGDIPVLNSQGNRRSLRAAAVRAGIPTVTLEAGEPMRLQRDMVDAGVETIRILMAKSGMYSKLGLWVQPEPAFYDSSWVRANSSGILLSRLELGDEVEEGDVLGAVNNPISNEQVDILSPHRGRILGMALDQFVMPGFAVYHIGIHAAKEELMEAGAGLDEAYDDLLGAEAEGIELLGPGGVLREEDPFDDE